MRKEGREELLLEYQSIREEILQKIELRNTLLACAYTATGVILSFAVGSGSSALALLPILLIIPCTMRIGYYRDATARLAAYQMVFIEPLLSGVN